MAFYYKRSNCFWVSYRRKGEKRKQKPLKTKDGYSVKDERVARYLTNEIENTIESGHSPIPKPETAAMAILNEYKEACRGIKGDRTIVNDYGPIREFLTKSSIGTIGEITELSLRGYLNVRLGAKEITPLTANHIMRYIHTFLNYAVKRGYISNNPLMGTARYKVSKKPPRFLTNEEVSKILQSAKTETLYPAILTAIYTGMRLGELQRLQWKDFNQELGIIMVEKSKTDKFRAIPMHPILKKTIKERMLPFDFTNSRRVFKRIKKKAKIMDIGFHKFRHTFASHLAQSGLDIYKISRYLGHNSIATTQIYAHLVPDKEDILRLKFT